MIGESETVPSPPVEVIGEGMFQVVRGCTAHVAIQCDVHIPFRGGPGSIRCPHNYAV